MEYNQLISTAKTLLGANETEKAIQLLLDNLDNNPDYSIVLRELRVISGNFTNTRQQERKQLLSFGEAQREYAKINDSILQILDDLALGKISKPNSGVVETSALKKQWLPWAIGGVVLMVLAGWFLFKGITKGQNTTENAMAEVPCPGFDGPGNRVILLPFQNASDKVARPELLLRQRIEDISSKNNFETNVKVFNHFDPNKSNIDVQSAREIGRRCDADMVIWGTYDNSGDSLRLDTRFVFTGSGKFGGTGFRAFKNLPALQQGRRISGLDDAVFSLCTMMALRSNNETLALKWVEKIKQANPEEKLMLQRLKDLKGSIQDKRQEN